MKKLLCIILAFTASVFGGCSLQEITKSPVSVTTNGLSLDFSPDGRFLAASTINNIQLFSFNQSTGATSQLQTIASDNSFIKYAPSGSYLASVTRGGNLSIYMVNQTTGELTLAAGSPVILPIGLGATNTVAISPDSNFIAVAGSNSVANEEQVFVFSVNQTTGALTGVTGSPFTIVGFLPDSEVGLEPRWISYSPNGSFLEVGLRGNNAAILGDIIAAQVAMFIVNPDGSLTGTATPLTAVGTVSTFQIFSLDSSSLIVPDLAANTINIFSVNQTTGELLLTHTIADNTAREIALNATCAFTIKRDPSSVNAYIFNGTTFSLAQSIAANDPYGIALSPNNLFVAIIENAGKEIRIFNTTPINISAIAQAIIAKYCTVS